MRYTSFLKIVEGTTAEKLKSAIYNATKKAHWLDTLQTCYRTKKINNKIQTWLMLCVLFLFVFFSIHKIVRVAEAGKIKFGPASKTLGDRWLSLPSWSTLPSKYLHGGRSTRLRQCFSSNQEKKLSQDVVRHAFLCIVCIYFMCSCRYAMFAHLRNASQS